MRRKKVCRESPVQWLPCDDYEIGIQMTHAPPEVGKDLRRTQSDTKLRALRAKKTRVDVTLLKQFDTLALDEFCRMSNDS